MPFYDIANMPATVKNFRREVYRNLRFRDETVYSVRKEGVVEGYAMTIILDGNTKYPVTFAVGPKGNQRVRDEQRKNVHAVIRGCIVNAVWHYSDMDAEESTHCKDACDYFKSEHMSEREGYEWKQVIYNPYKFRTFVTVDVDFDDNNPVFEPILTARKVIIGKEVWAQVPTQEKLNDN
jgi:hypothetical protein